MKNFWIGLGLGVVLLSGVPAVKADPALIYFPPLLGSYFATSTVSYFVCMQDPMNSEAECMILALLTTEITLDAYHDKQALQQVSEDAAAFLAGASEPSALLSQIFATIREKNAQQGNSSPLSDEELAYASLQMADALLSK